MRAALACPEPPDDGSLVVSGAITASSVACGVLTAASITTGTITVASLTATVASITTYMIGGTGRREEA